MDETGRHDERPGTKRWIRRGAVILALAAATAAAYFYWQRVSHAPEPTEVAPTGPVPVTAVTVREETVPVRLRFLGQTEASQLVEIRARVAGHLTERAFKEGEIVEQGQPLFQIDPRPFEVESAQAKAGLASAEATRTRSEQELKRYEALAAREAATPDRVEQARTEVQVAAAEVESQKARIAAAELQLEYAAISSPVTGRIGQALVDVGSYVAAATGPLAVVQRVDPMYVRYSVTEQEMLRFKGGLAAGRIVAPSAEETELQVTLADGSIYPHRGRINFLDVEIDLQTGTAVVRGTLPNPDGALIPGQFVYADVLGVSRANAIRVPQAAVMQSPAGANVFVVNENNVVETRPVTLGPWSGEDQWIVERGLKPGDRVVTDRLMTVRPGMAVTATEPVHPRAADATAETARDESVAASDAEATP